MGKYLSKVGRLSVYLVLMVLSSLTMTLFRAVVSPFLLLGYMLAPTKDTLEKIKDVYE